ncbi:MAG: IclR family transcriptional regulator C-terminal domain-containing protein [Atopobiaceae bacterium]|jgi:DNA-binding IclR family transcriptional regulator
MWSQGPCCHSCRHCLQRRLGKAKDLSRDLPATAYVKQLADVHTRRIAFDWGEITTAVNYVATPIRQAGKITYAISISVPAYRFDSKKQQEIIALLNASRTKLERSLN